MDWRALGAVAVALALATSAAAQPAGAGHLSHLLNDTDLLLFAGERVTVKLTPDGRLALVSAVRADPAEALPPKPGRRLAPGTGDPLAQVAEGAISLLMGPQGDATVLKVENGTSKAFDYRAVLLSQVGPTQTGEPVTVCTVLPLLPGYESWAGRHAKAMRLSHFTPRDTNEVVCPQPPSPQSAPSKPTVPPKS
ncbi:hypothetical protein DJ021_01840 [Phenylobacterium hankyongense]|uniref:Uncharacterized protein n=1 Tax=Phenylobacterium hankyongense TaxID=1813876 RepID=A0A328AUB0_9CAUL|nr:hypothetical protein [Phenylobacterium hankyongense]RAK58623.1 hypothetical protein DJ021_01840 [Phenylobacterium hankyongense]